MSSFDVHIPDEACMNDFYVKFRGPADTPFEGGVWRVHVMLPTDYPYKSPSIGFSNRIFHPNIDERSGSVCLDVINQTWSPMFDLVNIFESFLPQLLRYPNPSDPLNGEAAALLMDNEDKYNRRIRDSIAKYASSDFSVADNNNDDGDRKMSSETTSSTHSGDDGHDAKLGTEDMDGDIDDNASDVSDMSDL